MSKITSVLALSSLTLLCGATAAFATIQPNVQPVAIYSNNASIFGSANHGVEFQTSWGGGNGYFVATEDYHDGSTVDSTNGFTTSYTFYHYYSTYETHFGTLQVSSGAYNSSLDSNEVID